MSGLLLIAFVTGILGFAVPEARGAVVKSLLSALLVPMVTFVGGTAVWVLLTSAGWSTAEDVKGWIWCCAGVGLPAGTAASAWVAWGEED
jgi:hypothetical protein